MSEGDVFAADPLSLRKAGVNLGQWGTDVDTPLALLRGTEAEYPRDEAFGTGDDPTSKTCRHVVDPALDGCYSIMEFFRFALREGGHVIGTVGGVVQDANFGASNTAGQFPGGPGRH